MLNVQTMAKTEESLFEKLYGRVILQSITPSQRMRFSQFYQLVSAIAQYICSISD